MSSIDKGAHMIDLLNRVGLTAMAIGNHEYDFGPAVASQRFSEAGFPVLGANNVDTDGEVIDGAQASVMVDAGRFKVGIFGLTTVGTAVKSRPGGVVFRPVLETAAAQAARLRAAGAHLVIALAHTDAAEDAALRKQRAVDVLLSGDDHRLALEYDGAVLFAESGQQADWVTVIDLTLDEAEVPRREAVRVEPGVSRGPYRPRQPGSRACRGRPGIPRRAVTGPRRGDRPDRHRDGQPPGDDPHR